MRTKTRWLCVAILLATLSGCGDPAHQNQSAQTCPDLKQVVEAFYAATDALKPATSSPYLTDDIALIGWAEGANGHHMTIFSAVGKDQVQSFLGKPGLKMSATQPNLPNYALQAVQQSGLKVTFKLIPDRLHPDNRPYNPYYGEAFFSGCQIEILKVVEHVTWL